MYNNTNAFKNKLWLWKFQLPSNNMVCIVTVRMEKPSHTKKYTDVNQVHQYEFKSQFQDFRKHQATFGFVSSFVVNIKTVPHKFIDSVTRKYFFYQLGPHAQKVAYLCCWLSCCIAGRRRRSVFRWSW